MRKTLWRTLAAVVVSVALVGAGTASANSAATAKSGSSSKGYTQVAVAPEVFALISSAGIQPAAIKPATAFPFRNTLAARFPISSIDVAHLRIKHTGGIKLSAGQAKISLSRFTIDVNKLRIAGTVDGTIGKVPRALLFTIERTDNPSLGNFKLLLTKTAAGALNATFGVDAFSKGATFGYATIKPRA